MEKLSNDILTIEVSETGAELQSIRKAGSEHEYMWQGEPEYWNRRAPILFPMVGRVWNNQFNMDGKMWPMGQHGFARDCEFTLTERTDNAITFTLDSDAETLKLFPRDFRLQVRYTLVGSSLDITWIVKNTGTQALPFQIGAHPAFRYADWHAEDQLHGYMSFNVSDKLVSLPLAPGGYRSATLPTFDVMLDEQGRLPLGNNTFDCDTIIDSRQLIDSVSLHDKTGRRMLRVRFDMPVIALWSPNGGKCPFVCIEPWCGGCDIEGYDGLYADRDIINALLPGETFKNTYSIDID